MPHVHYNVQYTIVYNRMANNRTTRLPNTLKCFFGVAIISGSLYLDVVASPHKHDNHRQHIATSSVATLDTPVAEQDSSSETKRSSFSLSTILVFRGAIWIISKLVK